MLCLRVLVNLPKVSNCTASPGRLWVMIDTTVSSISLVAAVTLQADKSVFSPGFSPGIADIPIVLQRSTTVSSLFHHDLDISLPFQIQPLHPFTSFQYLTWCRRVVFFDSTNLRKQWQAAKSRVARSLLCFVEWPYPISTTAWFTTESLLQVSWKDDSRHTLTTLALFHIISIYYPNFGRLHAQNSCNRRSNRLPKI